MKIKSSIISAIILYIIFVFFDCDKAIANEIDTQDNENKSVYTLQIEQRSKLLKEALNEFGADSKEQAINIYSNGVKSRSGPMQYSVMNQKLKKEFEKKMNEEENYAWVTGTSSPWVTDYKIMKIKKVGSNEYKATVVFFLQTSSGSFGTSKTMLTINHKNNKWSITDINEDI